jgi:5'-nucleotidase
MISQFYSAALLVAVSFTPITSNAANILLTNDDGLTANAKALRAALIDAGHEVVMSVPCRNQSGSGGSFSFYAPIGPLATACLNGAAPAGAPGVGPIAALEYSYYVEGTPVASLMHGLDVASKARWGADPDLVISGPNEGQNAGMAVNFRSGTVANAQYALGRGIPAIAVSADANTRDNPALAEEVANLTVKLIALLSKPSDRHGVLPPGLALNVNFPLFAVGQSTQLPWALTRFGNFDYIGSKFVSDISTDPTAANIGLGNVHLPAIAVVTRTAADATEHTDQDSEALQMLKGNITVTPMDFGYELSKQELAHYLSHLLRDLHKDKGRKH